VAKIVYNRYPVYPATTRLAPRRVSNADVFTEDELRAARAGYGCVHPCTCDKEQYTASCRSYLHALGNIIQMRRCFRGKTYACCWQLCEKSRILGMPAENKLVA
jgi:hypothetical protein